MREFGVFSPSPHLAAPRNCSLAVLTDGRTSATSPCLLACLQGMVSFFASAPDSGLVRALLAMVACASCVVLARFHAHAHDERAERKAVRKSRLVSLEAGANGVGGGGLGAHLVGGGGGDSDDDSDDESGDESDDELDDDEGGGGVADDDDDYKETSRRSGWTTATEGTTHTASLGYVPPGLAGPADEGFAVRRTSADSAGVELDHPSTERSVSPLLSATGNIAPGEWL